MAILYLLWISPYGEWPNWLDRKLHLTMVYNKEKRRLREDFNRECHKVNKFVTVDFGPRTQEASTPAPVHSSINTNANVYTKALHSWIPIARGQNSSKTLSFTNHKWTTSVHRPLLPCHISAMYVGPWRCLWSVVGCVACVCTSFSSCSVKFLTKS